VAFDDLGRTIISGDAPLTHPIKQLRSDEIVWGRAPARLDLGGGWSDTPPYSLEHGGSVINAAIDLNGQPPIHCYGRVIPELVIRIASIDLGTRIEIYQLDELLDFRKANSEYSLVKAALALSGFSPEISNWPADVTLARMLELFGGGIELTTLAAVPKGSGLGTSSIMGAVICSVIARMMGRQLSQRELFYAVLKLEQALTTGGGWQDQIGGVVDAVKVVTTDAGLMPNARIHYVPSDVLDPHTNGGITLLYYTGITRLAKNILQQVVGRYLDRDRQAMATLKQIHALPPLVADAMARKDLAEFGRLIDAAWRLNKQLDPNSTTPEIDAMLDRVNPHLHGAKLLGAGGGGFLLMVCKSPTDAKSVQEMLQNEPPNPRARFFDFSLNRTGSAVNVC
jgi:galactokinase/mevalonate kinase-like predicted kinase